jgi:hypothetical protein
VKMEWEAFRDAHYRPSLMVVRCPRGIGSEDGKTACEELAASLELIGDYALKVEAQCIRIAFETVQDAQRFGEALGAKPSKPEPEWALALIGRLSRTTRTRSGAC